MRLSSVPAAAAAPSTAEHAALGFAARLPFSEFKAALDKLGFRPDPASPQDHLVLLGTCRRVRIAIEYRDHSVRDIDFGATLAKARAVSACAAILRDRLETAEAFGRLYDRTRHSLQ